MNKLKYWIKNYFYTNCTEYGKITIRSLATGLFVTALLAFIFIVILTILGAGYISIYYLITAPETLNDEFEILITMSVIMTIFISVIIYNEYLTAWASKFLDKRIATYNRPERNKEE